MQKINCLVLVCISWFSQLNAQLQADNWAYAYTKYVKFNQATNPTAHAYPCNGNRCYFNGNGKGAVTYSDASGRMLFFSNGVDVTDRNFIPFPSTDISMGGDPLKGTYWGTTNVSQNALAVPYPGTASKYILFHINSNWENEYNSHLYYSVIDMQLRNGLGEIDPAQRNISLLGGMEVSFKLTAIQHCNKRDIWVIGHLSNSDKYFSLLVTPSGIQTTPVYFSGSFISNSGVPYITNINDNGCIKVSATGTRLAAAYTGLDFTELFDFNTSTGTGSNVKRIKTIPDPADTVSIAWDAVGPFGVDFSPSGNKLYISATYLLRNSRQIFPEGSFVFQYDATLPGETEIQNSQYEVCKLDTSAQSGALQIANNGVLYVNINSDLYAIGNPERTGPACNFYPANLNIPNHQGSSLNLPNYMQSYFQFPVITSEDCQSQTINFKVHDTAGLITSILWDFDDPASGGNNSSVLLNPSHTFSEEGIYAVKAILYSSTGCVADTIKKIISAGQFQVSLGKDTTLCMGDSLKLSISEPGVSLLWSDSSTNNSYTVNQSGKYWVSAVIGSCTASDTITIEYAQPPYFSIGADTAICANSSILLKPTVLYSGATYLWNNSITGTNLEVNSAGEYWLMVTDTNSCIWRDSVAVSFKLLADFNIGRDTAICEGDSVVMNASIQNASAYLWNTGATTSEIKVGTSGIYWCDASVNGCGYRDSAKLTVYPYPIVNLGSDTVLCEGITLNVNADNNDADYIWQDNSTNSFYTITGEGAYNVKVNRNGCITTDTINVAYQLKPYFSLGSDRLICAGEPVRLNPQVDTSWQLGWQDGSIHSSYSVTQPGNYYLTATNICGSYRDDITISEGLCNLYIPSAFTPNGDDLNSRFRILGTSLITHFDLKIYNRYGQLVFGTSNKNETWDGYYKGKLAESGAYFYLLQYRSNTASQVKSKKGTILLIR